MQISFIYFLIFKLYLFIYFKHYTGMQAFILF